MSSKHREILEAIPLPHMTPDIFDKFVDYVSDRVDIRSFERSSQAYKYQMFKQFFSSLKIEDKQYAITFPDK